MRIPVGYWVLEGDEPYTGAKQHLDWAMDMAERYGLQVIIDVHGLPGSQNGYDHSGRAGRSLWHRQAGNRQRSVDRVVEIARRYRDSSSLWGIQVINEPRVGLFNYKLRRYYRQVYDALVEVARPATAIVVSDAFTPRLMSGALVPTVNPVVMDIHSYHMTTLLAQFLSVEWFLSKLKRRKSMLRRLSRTQSVIIGEWSGVMRHQTMNRLPKSQHAKLFAHYIAAQLDAYSVTAGWFYWSYKTERPDQWNFRSQVEAGLIDLEQP